MESEELISRPEGMGTGNLHEKQVKTMFFSRVQIIIVIEDENSHRIPITVN